MSRIYEHELGMEKAFINSYNGWDETDEGVQFYDCDFKLAYSFHGADCLFLNYARCEAVLYRGDYVVRTYPIRIALN